MKNKVLRLAAATLGALLAAPTPEMNRIMDEIERIYARQKR
jgi:hypothetical protein